jgi:hypothetical protein
MKIASQLFGPKDFSVGLMQEMLVTLCKFGFSPNMAKEIANVKSGMAKKVVDLFMEEMFASLKAEWQVFYKKYLNMDVDFSMLSIPRYPGLGWRLLIIAQGISSEQVFRAMKNLFKAWKNMGAECRDMSLDEAIPFNERDSKNGAYAIWVRDVRGADKIHECKSVYKIAAEKLTTETVTECLIHELKYFQETGKHLGGPNDETLCSGSRDRHDNAVSVGWNSVDNTLYVSWELKEHTGSRTAPCREVIY